MMQPDTLAGKGLADLPPGLRAVLLRHYGGRRGGVHERFEGLIGERKRLRFNMYPDACGVVVTVEDISREWRSGEAARLALQTMSSLPDAVFMVNRTGLVVYANDRACTFTGYPREQLQGMEIRRVRPGLGIGRPYTASE